MLTRNISKLKFLSPKVLYSYRVGQQGGFLRFISFIAQKSLVSRGQKNCKLSYSPNICEQLRNIATAGVKNTDASPYGLIIEETQKAWRVAGELISRGSHNLEMSKKAGELAGNLSKCSEELEKKLVEQESLKNTIANYDEIKSKDNLPNDLQEFLQQKIDELYEQLKEVNGKIEE
jgi:hypothetical protein